jgi:hypothetical protein
MTQAGWLIRQGLPGDRELLASFACANPAVRWQSEVEQFIQGQLTDWAFDPTAAEGDPRLLLAFTAAAPIRFGSFARNKSFMIMGARVCRNAWLGRLTPVFRPAVDETSVGAGAARFCSHIWLRRHRGSAGNGKLTNDLGNFFPGGRKARV